MDPSGLVSIVAPGGNFLPPIDTDPSGFLVTLVPAGRVAGDPEWINVNMLKPVQC